MTFLRCPQCNHEISASVTACPKCGQPLKSMNVNRGTRKKVLVVDDEKDVRLLISNRLRVNGYEPIEAEDGEMAVEAAKKHKPHLIILDYLMPKMDGFRTLGRLRIDTQTSKIPVIMLTAKGETSTIMQAQTLGVKDYIIKPFDPIELLDLVEKNIA